MKLNPRHQLVTRAELEVRQGLDRTISALGIDEWPNILYHVAMIKAILLREMGADVAPDIKVNDIPNHHHVLAMAVYKPMMDWGLTNAELYQIITDWELREARGMVKAERNGDTDEE